MFSENLVPISLGVVAIILAVGINLYRNWQENKTKRKNELFFIEQIQKNLKKMAQYFLDIENETKHNEEYTEDNHHMMVALDTFYLKHKREMNDVLSQTKLYLPFWTSLLPQDKTTVHELLDVFSWVLYDYYSKNSPESLREITIINSRNTFLDKKNLMMTAADELLKKYTST